MKSFIIIGSGMLGVLAAVSSLQSEDHVVVMASDNHAAVHLRPDLLLEQVFAMYVDDSFTGEVIAELVYPLTEGKTSKGYASLVYKPPADNLYVSA